MGGSIFFCSLRSRWLFFDPQYTPPSAVFFFFLLSSSQRIRAMNRSICSRVCVCVWRGEGRRHSCEAGGSRLTWTHCALWSCFFFFLSFDSVSSEEEEEKKGREKGVRDDDCGSFLFLSFSLYTHCFAMQTSFFFFRKLFSVRINAGVYTSVFFFFYFPMYFHRNISLDRKSVV